MQPSDYVNIYQFHTESVYHQSNIHMNTEGITDNGKYTAYFNLEEYLADIIYSYDKNSSKVIEQFERDFNRHSVKLNGKYYTDSIQFIKDLMSINIHGGTSSALTIILCCQSSLALPFEIIKKIYDNEDNNTLLKHDSNKKMKIDIVLTDQMQSIDINASFEKILIEPYLKTHTIDMVITLDTTQSNLELGVHKLAETICVFNWHIVPI